MSSASTSSSTPPAKPKRPRPIKRSSMQGRRARGRVQAAVISDVDASEQMLVAMALGAGLLMPAAPMSRAASEASSVISVASTSTAGSVVLSPPSPSPPPAPPLPPPLKTVAGRLRLSVGHPSLASDEDKWEDPLEISFTMGDRTSVPRYLLPLDAGSTPPKSHCLLEVQGVEMDAYIDESPRSRRVAPVLALQEFCRAAGAVSRLDRDGEVAIDFLPR